MCERARERVALNRCSSLQGLELERGARSGELPIGALCVKKEDCMTVHSRPRGQNAYVQQYMHASWVAGGGCGQRLAYLDNRQGKPICGQSDAEVFDPSSQKTDVA